MVRGDDDGQFPRALVHILNAYIVAYNVAVVVAVVYSCVVLK